jgi:hypothetical protein
MLFSPYRNIFSAYPPGSRPFFKMAAKLQEDCLWQAKFATLISCMCKLYFCCIKHVIQLHLFHYMFYYLTKNNLYNRKNMKWVIYFALLRHTGINQCRLSRHWVLYQLLFKVLPNTLWLNRENQLFWIKSTLWHCWDRVRFQ